jgi:hypothetical protein
MLCHSLSFCYFVHMCDADPVTNPWGCLPSWIAKRPSNSNTRNSPSWSTFFWGRGFLWHGSFSRTSQITICQAWHRPRYSTTCATGLALSYVDSSCLQTGLLCWIRGVSERVAVGESLRMSQIVGQGPRMSKSSRLSIPFFISVCVAELPKICIKLYQTWSFEPSKHSHHKLT